MSDDIVDSLLPDLYGCADEPSRWRSVLDGICHRTNARSAVVQMLRRTDDSLSSEWTVRDSTSSDLAESHDRYVNNDQNPRLNLKIARGLSGPAAVMRDEERFRPGCPHLARLRKRLAKIGMGESISIALGLPMNRQLTLLLHRAHGDGRKFGCRDEAFLWELAPHLKQAVALFEKVNALREDAHLMREFANRLTLGVVIVDRHGIVQWKNQYAALTLDGSEHLGVVGGRLRCSYKDAHNRIFRFLDRVDSLSQRLLTTIGTPYGKALQILAVPVRIDPPSARRPRDASIAILLSAADSKVALAPSDIRDLFGLTPAEATLAAALSEGLTLTEYAEQRGVSVGTTRIQLKSIFSKTGTSRQPELIGLLCSSVSARTLMGHPELAGVLQSLEIAAHADQPGSR